MNSNVKFCQGCGRQLHLKASICPECGISQTTAGNKSRTTAAILAFFLGGIGIHRFYLEQPGLGFLYLIFCWTFIPVFLAFLDFLVFISQKDEQFNLKYN